MRRTAEISVSLSVSVAILVAGVSISAQDNGKYAVKVPNGLAFAEFRGYEYWAVIAFSGGGGKVAVTLGNAVTIDAYKQGIPGNGKPFPDGAKMAKIHWLPKRQESFPGQPTVPGTLHDVGFMVKDSKRFADSGGWGWGAFDYDEASGTFRPGNAASRPPQGNDAKCGLACHTNVAARDYVFTEYGKR
jgi:Cytochrome P460